MTAPTPEARVRRIVGRALDRDPDSFYAGNDLIHDLGADSFDAITIILDIEEAFGIEISDAETDAARTVGDLVEMVVRKVGA